jgi:dienelactone hydrolase
VHPALKRALRPIVRATRARRIVAGASAAAAGVWGTINGDRAAVRFSTVSYQCMDRPVPALFCEPTRDAANLAGVVYLHPLNGPLEMPPGLFTKLARAGIATLAIEYFALTPAPGPNPKAFGYAHEHRLDREFLDAAMVWPRVITDGVSFLQRQPRVDPERIGVVGFSAGAAMAVKTAGTAVPYKAVVDLSGFTQLAGVPLTSQFWSHDLPARAPSFPPTLILHGERDDVVPVSEAYAIRDALRAAGTTPEVHIHPHVRHAWTGSAGRDARGRVVDFLVRHLAAR